MVSRKGEVYGVGAAGKIGIETFLHVWGVRAREFTSVRLARMMDVALCAYCVVD
jgi:hypothetical protein